MNPYILLTPGPTPVPENILAKTAQPLYHHRTPEFGKILNQVFENLKYVFQTNEAEVFTLAASGTGAMEAGIVNFFSPGDHVLICPIGAFGERWRVMLQVYGLRVDVISAPLGQAVDVNKVKSHLEKNPDIAGVFATHVDTSTATLNPIQDLAALVKNRETLFLVDAVSSLGGEEFYQDKWGVDVCVSASQKGLMCPPGLGFLSVSPKAMERLPKSKLPKFYWDLKLYKEAKAIPETPFTPPVSLLAGLHEALAMVRAETLETQWQNFKTLATFTRDSLSDLGCRLFSSSPAHVLTAVYLPKALEEAGANSTTILKHIRDTYRVVLADGQGPLKGKIFRIAHMGAIKERDVKSGLKALKETFSKFRVKV